MSVTEPEGTATPWPSDQLRDALGLGAPELIQGLPRVADERCVNVGLTSQHDQVDVKAVGVEDSSTIRTPVVARRSGNVLAAEREPWIAIDPQP
jgi:hypothetical protein